MLLCASKGPLLNCGLLFAVPFLYILFNFVFSGLSTFDLLLISGKQRRKRCAH